ncbi:MAG: hypothetical protein HY286_05785 [Planctomycetes bacterium]|nr:hypothetical protein [Planctomycetota bacterium]
MNCFILFAILIQAPSRPASSPSHDPFPVYVWRDQGPPTTAEWASAIRALGFSGTNVQGSGDARAITGLGLDFYVDGVASRPVFHRDPDDPIWEKNREFYFSTGAKSSLLREPSLDDPVIIDNLRKQTASRAAAAADAGARFISIIDEPSFTVGLDPFDYDYSPASIVQFQERVRAAFPQIQLLNRAWDCSYSDFKDIIPWTAGEIAAREWQKKGSFNFAPWAAARDHADQSFTEALGAAMDAARNAAPGRPVGFLGANAPGAYGGFDWGRLLALKPALLEVYDAGAARDLVRAMAPDVEFVDTTFATPNFTNYPPALAAARMSWLFARGGRGSIVWANSAMFENGDWKRSTALARALGERAKQLRSLAERMTGARVEFDNIGIVYSHPSIQIGWLLDSRADGNSRMRRSTSYELEHSTALASLEGWFRICEDLGYAPRAIDARMLKSAAIPKVLILPRTLALSPEEASALRAHAAAGGVLLAEGRPAIFNNQLIGGTSRGALDDLFGIGELQFSGFVDANCNISVSATRNAAGLAILEPNLSAAAANAAPASVFEGKHSILYNISFTEYRDRRLESENEAARALREIVGRAFLQFLGPPPVSIVPGPSIPLATSRERRGDDLFIYVSANARRNPARVQQAGAPISVTLQIRGVSAGIVERLDAPAAEPTIARSDGVTTLQFPLAPLHLALFRVRRAEPR